MNQCAAAGRWGVAWKSLRSAVLDLPRHGERCPMARVWLELGFRIAVDILGLPGEAELGSAGTQPNEE